MTYPATGAGNGANLADILERVLDRGVVIVGDIRINLLDIELLTIKLRLIVASVERAEEMGIDWWRDDPSLSAGARRREMEREREESREQQELARENAELRARLAALEGRRDALADGTEESA
ncbi:gas vesicle protein [Streptomyces sp. Ru73]|uniref:gas vesicle protein n=1 Tax=Streptomyces sp. Ru73 TaxID=2080748 RepID=UPI000CDDE611|nr:gas vesicle protein [Streptomyces sp. Ru73]POX39331.1 gas vesicle protein [Streptomyces sp. Ru73]